ncbi:MAG: hypothetical protein H7068_05145 [Pedobacter sp.]|nr:hypothetical protein [Chitinophagaceae bacterium]
MTTKLFWDYYEFTGDKKYLKEVTYPAILGMSKFLSKVVKDTAGLLLASPSYSPEQRSIVDNLHYKTIGCAFDQQMIFENHNDVLKAAKMINDNDAFLLTIQNQLPKLDPVQMGWSGQIKEYREEKYYGELVADKKHRHTSQLVGLYPGTIINSNTPAWLDAAKLSLNNRGDKATGWAMAHRLNLWARAKEGNRAYDLLKAVLQNATLNNLWDNCPPFDVDGNFGTTAGVAEMLLQSHEGFIDLLPAIPQQWATGSYKGLLARGNFEVGAKWENNQATQFTIKSNIGGTCKLKYYNIEKAIVKNAAGKVVNVFSNKRDFIEFKTKAGDQFTIIKIQSYKKVSNPSNLVIKETKPQSTIIQWDKSADAVAYNVYAHYKSSPDYTLIKKNLTATNFECDTKELSTVKYGLLRVTAVDKVGRESSGVIVTIEAKEKDKN